MITYDYYRIFYFVAQYHSFTKAAEILKNNQPNITRCMNNLESELGCKLFIRSHQGVTLTAEGEKVYERVAVAYEQLRTVEEELALERSLESGLITIGASETALRLMLLSRLEHFHTRYPHVRLRISNHSTPQAIDALKCGTADFAVVTTPTVHSASLTETNIKPISEVAVCSPGFSSLKGKKISLAVLQNYPLISLGSDTKSFEFYSKLFADFGCIYNPIIEAFTADQILPIVEAGLGIGFVPCDFIRPHDNVMVIDLVESIPARNICIIKRSEQPLSIAAKKLELMILEC